MNKKSDNLGLITTHRRTRCRGCGTYVPSKSMVIKNNNYTGSAGDIFLCEDCMYDIAVIAMNTVGSAIEFDEFIVMRKLAKDKK